jgi:hypothetical protein
MGAERGGDERPRLERLRLGPQGNEERRHYRRPDAKHAENGKENGVDGVLSRELEELLTQTHKSQRPSKFTIQNHQVEDF